MFQYRVWKCALLILLISRNIMSQPTVFTKQWFKDTKCVTDEDDILTTLEFILVDLQRLRFDTKQLKDSSAFAKATMGKIKEDISKVKSQSKKIGLEMGKVRSEFNVIKINTKNINDAFSEFNKTAVELSNNWCNYNSTTDVNQNSLHDISNVIYPVNITTTKEVLKPEQGKNFDSDKHIFIESHSENDINNLILNSDDSVYGKSKIHVSHIDKLASDDNDNDDTHNIYDLEGESLFEIETFSGEKVGKDPENDTFLRDGEDPKQQMTTETLSKLDWEYADDQNTTEKFIETVNNTIPNILIVEDQQIVVSDDLDGIKILDFQPTVVQNEEDKPDIFTDCSEAVNQTSGVFIISPSGSNESFQVYCQFDDNGQWLVFQRRQNGDVDFYRDWDDYRTGFGQLEGEFWLGNNKLHLITKQEKYILRIDMWDWDMLGTGAGLGKYFYAESDSFSIGNETEFYRLHVPNGFYDYSGFGGSGLRVHAGPFMTFDKRHPDMRSNCAQLFHTGWWFKTCVRNANLNGKYYQGGYAFPETRTRALDGIFWRNIPRSLKKVEMKIKRLSST